jgi:hypothetical protein
MRPITRAAPLVTAPERHQRRRVPPAMPLKEVCRRYWGEELPMRPSFPQKASIGFELVTGFVLPGA